MFYVKHQNGEKGPNHVPNTSHLHKLSSSTHSQIPRKQSTDKIHVASSVVSNFLQAVSAKENGTTTTTTTNAATAPVRNTSSLFKSQQTVKLTPVQNEQPIFNHLGLRKVNSNECGGGGGAGASAGGVANKIKSFNNEYVGKPVDEPEVVLRTKNTFEKPKQNSVTSRNNSTDGRSSSDDKWKVKYEDAEKRRKELLTESQKLAREKNNLEQRLKRLEDEYRNLKDDHTDQNQQLNKLRRVSEQVYQDYDKLSSKYETETKTLHKALEVASKWYTENKKLKRESVALRSSAMTSNLLDTIKDEPDGDQQSQDELEELRKTVQDLSNQVGQLQSELNRARLQEFEAQEQFINLTQALDEEKKEKGKMEQELKELRLMKQKFESVTYMVHDQMKALKTERDRANETANRLQAEAHEAKKERNVLAHQSSFLMGEISSNETLIKALLEMEDLKRRLEEESQNHSVEIQKYQEKLEFRESEAQLELMEEKLKLAESELQLALQRAEQAEQNQQMLTSKVSQLQTELNSKSDCAPPPPPPPPPPLPPLMMNSEIKLTAKKMESTPKPSSNGNSLDDMANILGIQRTPKNNNVQGGAIDDIINEIKGGKFTLKATEKQKMKKEEPPPAVQEMLNIIGTLKRRPIRARPPPADVHL